MHIRETIKNFLYDKEYFISIYDNGFYAFNYLDIKKITNNEIILKFNNFKIYFFGNDFFVSQMTKNELKVNGNINKLEYKYE